MEEFNLIRKYFTWPIKDPSVVLGVGDDAALFSLEQGCQLVTTTDSLVEGVHFSASTTAKDIAHKTLAVNLSDIAAMGAKGQILHLSDFTTQIRSILVKGVFRFTKTVINAL
tara:strand:- start:331 stop:666 length:336 start_codon:yes stop_codon:yes gene_type:complete